MEMQKYLMAYNSKMAKHKNPSGSFSPLMMKYLSSSSNSNSSSNASSPLSRMSNNSNSPFSAVDEEDVLVMDGILVSNDGYRRSSEEVGSCRFGSKSQSQLACGKDELRSTRVSIGKNKSEEKIFKSYITGSCTYGSKCRFIHHDLVMTDSALVLSTTQMDTGGPVDTSKTSNALKSELNIKDDWSPEDDGIEVTLPSKPPGIPPTREEVREYVHSILYGANGSRRRLPVFAKICPES